MFVNAINNPRKDNGDFGDECCDICGNYSGAYVDLTNDDFGEITQYTFHTNVCKGCLLNWVDLIDKTVLNDAKEKGMKPRP